MLGSALLFDSRGCGFDLHAAGLAELNHGVHLIQAHVRLLTGLTHLTDDVEVGIPCDVGLGDLARLNRTDQPARTDNLLGIFQLFKHCVHAPFQTYPNI